MLKYEKSAKIPLKFTSQSIYQQDFIQNSEIVPENLNKSNYKPSYEFSTGTSSYRDEFISKKTELVESFESNSRSNHAFNLEFNGKTTYKTDFVKVNQYSKPERFNSASKIKIFSDASYSYATSHRKDFSGHSFYKLFDGAKGDNLRSNDKKIVVDCSVKMKTTNQREFEHKTSPVKNIHRRLPRVI